MEPELQIDNTATSDIRGQLPKTIIHCHAVIQDQRDELAQKELKLTRYVGLFHNAESEKHHAEEVCRGKEYKISVLEEQIITLTEQLSESSKKIKQEQDEGTKISKLEQTVAILRSNIAHAEAKLEAAKPNQKPHPSTQSVDSDQSAYWKGKFLASEKKHELSEKILQDLRRQNEQLILRNTRIQNVVDKDMKLDKTTHDLIGRTFDDNEARVGQVLGLLEGFRIDMGTLRRDVEWYSRKNGELRRDLWAANSGGERRRSEGNVKRHPERMPAEGETPPQKRQKNTQTSRYDVPMLPDDQVRGEPSRDPRLRPVSRATG